VQTRHVRHPSQLWPGTQPRDHDTRADASRDMWIGAAWAQRVRHPSQLWPGRTRPRWITRKQSRESTVDIPSRHSLFRLSQWPNALSLSNPHLKEARRLLVNLGWPSASAHPTKTSRLLALLLLLPLQFQTERKPTDRHWLSRSQTKDSI
jgi:hypothetical protein